MSKREYELSIYDMYNHEITKTHGSVMSELKAKAHKHVHHSRHSTMATISREGTAIWTELINPNKYILVCNKDSLPYFSRTGSDKNELIKEGNREASSVRIHNISVRVTTTKTNKTIYVASYLNGDMEFQTYYGGKE